MLIISKFHDYYDSALHAGIDKTVVFRRKTEEIEAKEWMQREKYFQELQLRAWYGNTMYYKDTFYTKKNVKYELKLFIVGFCGKVYKGVIIDDTYHYNITSLRRKMIKLGIIFELNDISKFEFYAYDCPEMIKEKIVSFINVGDKYYSLYQSRLGKAFVSTGIAVINPVLKDYQFYRCMPTYSAFQEIYMYISGVIGTGEKEMIQINDKDMRDKKGFDKYSFKHPFKIH